jgi:hypothetical protein
MAILTELIPAFLEATQLGDRLLKLMDGEKQQEKKSQGSAGQQIRTIISMLFQVTGKTPAGLFRRFRSTACETSDESFYRDITYERINNLAQQKGCKCKIDRETKGSKDSETCSGRDAINYVLGTKVHGFANIFLAVSRLSLIGGFLEANSE